MQSFSNDEKQAIIRKIERSNEYCKRAEYFQDNNLQPDQPMESHDNFIQDIVEYWNETQTPHWHLLNDPHELSKTFERFLNDASKHSSHDACVEFALVKEQGKFALEGGTKAICEPEGMGHYN